MLICVGVPRGASACVVCVEIPERTLSDRIWAAESVVLARPDTEDVFRYEIAEVLVGHPSSEINFLVNSVERRLMAQDKGRVAVLLHGPDGWEIAAKGSLQMVELVSEILSNKSQWSDEPNDPDRIAAFGELHSHEDPGIRRVALTELSRATYPQLREIDVLLDPFWLEARLSDPAWFGWRPILAHLLGLSTDPRAHSIVRSRALEVPASLRWPWLAALIEIDGSDAIDRILDQRPQGEEALAAVQALNLHADANSMLAPSIGSALRTLGAANPVMAAEAVTGLATLQDYAFVPEVVRLLAEGQIKDPAAEFSLMVYLASARKAARLASTPPLEKMP